MPLISIDLNQARQTAGTFSSSGNTLDDVCGHLQQQWSSLSSTWEGDSKYDVTTDVNAVLNRGRHCVEFTRERGAKVTQIADRFQAADENEPFKVAAILWSGIANLFMIGAIGGADLAAGMPTDLDDQFEKFKAQRPQYTAEIVGYPRAEIEKWLAQQAGFYRPDITDAEADLFDELRGPLGLDVGKINQMQEVSNEAFSVEQEIFPNKDGANNDGVPDAFRHAYWSARLTQEYGADWATRFTDAHESKPGNEAGRDFMDRWNNSLGIRIAQQHPNASPQEIKSLIIQSIKNGEGVYIPGADQFGINSPERNALTENGPVAFTNQDPTAQAIQIPPVDDTSGHSDGSPSLKK